MMALSLFSMALCSILIIVNFAVSKKSYLDREKTSPFECGFEPMNSSRIPFSLRFYMIAIVFLVFDVEIALILPIPILEEHLQTPMLMSVVLYFIFILIMGLLHEWNQGALEWES